MASVGHEIVIAAPPEVVWDIDDEARRLAYAVVEGARPPTEFHHATFEVRPEGAGASRMIWTTGVLPHALAGLIRVRMQHGAWEMKQAIESADRLRK